MAASSTRPPVPNSRPAALVRASAPSAGLGMAPPDRAPTWASMQYTASSSTPAITPAQAVERTTAPGFSTPRARRFTAMTMPKARAARVSMV